MTCIGVPTHDLLRDDLKKTPTRQFMLFSEIVVASVNLMRPEGSDATYLR
jgi:hypothetical protein